MENPARPVAQAHPVQSRDQHVVPPSALCSVLPACDVSQSGRAASESANKNAAALLVHDVPTNPLLVW